jgi:hypothetical protein
MYWRLIYNPITKRSGFIDLYYNIKWDYISSNSNNLNPKMNKVETLEHFKFYTKHPIKTLQLAFFGYIK